MNKESVDGMLKDLMYEVEIETIQGSTATFIKSLNEGFKQYGSLTEKQESALRRIFVQHLGSSL